MQEYNNIVSEYSEYFFENFKGGKGGGLGGGRKKKKTKKEEEDGLRDNVRNFGIFFAIFAFIYYIFPKQTTTILKRYEAFDYINNIAYLAIFIIIIVLLYMIVKYFYNNNYETPIADT
jgi:hypothetical protein